MNADAEKLTNDFLSILNYPLVKMGTSNLTLASLFLFVTRKENT